MKPAPRIYVLAPVHNRRATTEKFIRLLLAQTYCNWQLILIDDGSSDGTQDMARALVPETALTVLRGTGRWWWAGSLHQGFLWLKRHRADLDDLVVTMNDDTEFDVDFLAKAVKAVKPRSLFLARCCNMKGELDEVGVFWDWRKVMAHAVTDPAAVNCFPTRGLFVHVNDFLELGGFHPFLLPHYLSDYEFTMRAHRKGFALISAPDVFLRFDDSPELTGMRTFIEGLPPLKEMRRSLSIRSTSNPIFYSSLVILGSPIKYLPLSLCRVWWRFAWPLRAWVILTVIAPMRRAFRPVKYFMGRIKGKVQREWAARNDSRR